MLPHQDLPALHSGPPLAEAAAVMVMIHGRGAGPRDIMSLSATLDVTRVARIAPTAAGNTWYPFSFMSPRENNEPGLSSALAVIESIVTDLLGKGIPAHKIVLLGFSQGACLSSEFTIRRPRRYGALLALSGGLVGPDGTTWDDVTTSLDGMPVFLGCSDVDPHIPKGRVLESEAVFKRLGAQVTAKLYPGMGHTVSDDEIAHVQAILDAVVSSP